MLTKFLMYTLHTFCSYKAPTHQTIKFTQLFLICMYKFTLDGLTHRRIHLSTCDHILPCAWHGKWNVNHIRVWSGSYTTLCIPCARRMWTPVHIHSTCQVLTGQDVIAGRQCDQTFLLDNIIWYAIGGRVKHLQYFKRFINVFKILNETRYEELYFRWNLNFVIIPTWFEYFENVKLYFYPRYLYS